MNRIDERDAMFSRMELKPGSKEYDDYYKRNPEKKDRDDELRNKPQLLGEGTMTYHPVNSTLPNSVFRFLGDIKQFSEGPVADRKVELTPEAITKKLKLVAKYFGATDVGITEIKDEFLYSYRGRRAEVYGDEVNLNHKYAIVYTMEMDKDMVNRAPFMEQCLEVTKAYLDGAIIGMMLTYFLNDLGYEARNHMDGNYLMVAPLVAESAGLGQIGRAGLLITKESGQRVRIGSVSTNLELVPDEPKDMGIPEFCEICAKCVKTCPGKAIPGTPREELDGKLRWQVSQENCYDRWRSLGTDCGICLSACPFSQGVDSELFDQMKNDDEAKKKILRQHEEQYGIRKFIKEPFDIMKDE